MKLEKAMQTSRQILDGKELPSVADRNAAIALGYEAISRIQDMRSSPCTDPFELLPGETDE